MNEETPASLQELQKEYITTSEGKGELLRVIDEAEISDHVYNSNAIENSTLTLEETDKILQQIDLDRFISERELFETKNLARVVEYIRTTAIREEMSLEMMRLLHKMLISNIRDDIAGRFRMDNEWVRVGNHVAADPQHISGLLSEALTAYFCSTQENITKRIARFHLSFEHTHPFVDGNGRIGRIINNYLLIRDRHVPINIKFLDRKQYYEAFQEFDAKGEVKIMEKIISNALKSSYHKRLAYLKGKRIITLKEFSKTSDQSPSNLINKAKRQTISAFWDKGLWKIGV